MDPMHSEVQFKVKHLMITNVTGYFRKFDIEAETESDDFTSTKKLEFTADVNSIDTNNDQRDTHLKSDDFFNAAEFGQIEYVGKSFQKNGDKFRINGELTIRNHTKEVPVDIEFLGTVTDPYGQFKAGFSADAKINRKDFGLKWNATTEAGRVVVGDEIRIHAEVQMIKQTS